VHWTVRCTPDSEQCAGSARAENPLIGYFLLLGDTGSSDAPLDRCSWPTWQLTVARLAHRTVRCLADHPVNYSRRRLEFSRVAIWLDRAPDCPVGGTGPSGALQSSTFSLCLFFVFFCSLFYFIRSLALRQI
jgi:hypothetical protein